MLSPTEKGPKATAKTVRIWKSQDQDEVYEESELSDELSEGEK